MLPWWVQWSGLDHITKLGWSRCSKSPECCVWDLIWTLSSLYSGKSMQGNYLAKWCVLGCESKDQTWRHILDKLQRFHSTCREPWPNNLIVMVTMAELSNCLQYIPVFCWLLNVRFRVDFQSVYTQEPQFYCGFQIWARFRSDPILPSNFLSLIPALVVSSASTPFPTWT